MKNKIVKRFACLSAIICLFAFSGFAQIQGGVFDQKKQGISNALITASDTNRVVIDSVRSDNRGFYIFKGLKPGKYRIEAKATGFRPSVYENIKANAEDPDEETGRDDISNATRLEIFLKPDTVPK